MAYKCAAMDGEGRKGIELSRCNDLAFSVMFRCEDGPGLVEQYRGKARLCASCELSRMAQSGNTVGGARHPAGACQKRAQNSNDESKDRKLKQRASGRTRAGIWHFTNCEAAKRNEGKTRK